MKLEQNSGESKPQQHSSGERESGERDKQQRDQPPLMPPYSASAFFTPTTPAPRAGRLNAATQEAEGCEDECVVPVTREHGNLCRTPALFAGPRPYTTLQLSSQPSGGAVASARQASRRPVPYTTTLRQRHSRQSPLPSIVSGSMSSSGIWLEEVQEWEDRWNEQQQHITPERGLELEQSFADTLGLTRAEARQQLAQHGGDPDAVVQALQMLQASQPPTAPAGADTGAVALQPAMKQPSEAQPEAVSAGDVPQRGVMSVPAPAVTAPATPANPASQRDVVRLVSSSPNGISIYQVSLTTSTATADVATLTATNSCIALPSSGADSSY